MDIKKQIRTILNQIRHSGDYCGGGKIDIDLPNLIISGVGLLVFPLVETQAKKIINRCNLAPFGYRDQTLYDIRVRRTWQLEPNVLEVDTLLWSSETITHLKQRIITDLGLQRTNDEIQIELYKILLYEKGSFFKTHRDTEKKDGMFATLLIILPSYYTGGKLVIRHQQHEKEFDFSGDRQNIHYVVLYADCEHELLPVSEGYRLVLAYNVILLPNSDNKQIVESEHNQMHINQLNKVFSSWLDRTNNDKINPRKLIIPLDHEYTQASMKNGPLLKGKDAIIGEIIRYASENEKNRLLLYCIMLERSDEKIQIDYYEPFGEPSQPFTQYCATLGYRHQEKISIASTDLLDENVWNKLKLKIVEGPWTGNEAEYSHRWYNLSALLLLPKNNRYDLILCLADQNGKFVYDTNYELWTVLHKLEECKSSDDHFILTSATLDLIIEGIQKSGFELSHNFRTALLQCLIALAFLNKTNQEIMITIQNLIEQNLLVKEFFSVFSTRSYGMHDRMADILFNAGNIFGWSVIADRFISLFREEFQSSKYSSESYLEERIGRILPFLSKLISLIKNEKRDDDEEVFVRQNLLNQIMKIFSTIVIQVIQKIISDEQKPMKDKDKTECNRYYSFYKHSKMFSIKSLCSFVKVLTIIDIDSETNEILDDIIHHIQILIDHDSNNNGYRSFNSEYETTVDSMIKYIIISVIYPFLKEIHPYRASWYFALIDFCQTVVKSQVEIIQMNINKAHTIFQSVRLTCSCTYCQQMNTFLKDSNRYEYKYDQYRTQSHVYSSINKLNLPVRLTEGKFIKDIKLYDSQKRYTELLINLNDLHR